MKSRRPLWLRRLGAAVGVALTLALFVAQGVSAAPIPARHGAARAPEPAARWQPTAASHLGATGQVRASGTANWQIIYRASTPMYLVAVEALNQGDAWAVGYTLRDHAVALHWTRGRWRSVPIPDSSQFFPQYVAASSPQNVWVFGYRNTTTGQTWQAMRWDGRAWHPIPAPPDPGVPNEIGFLVLGPANVWFPSEGSCHVSGRNYICSTPVCHWNGRRWIAYQLNSDVTSLAASRRSNLWAVGFRPPVSSRAGLNARPVVYRWAGSVWRSIRMPRHPTTGFHNGGPVIDTSGPDNVWIGSASESNVGSSLLMHFDGRGWHGYQSGDLGGTAVIDRPLGVWTSPWTYWTGRTWQVLTIPTWMNTVYYLSRVPRSSTMLAVGGTLLRNNQLRAEIFSYGQFG